MKIRIFILLLAFSMHQAYSQNFYVGASYSFINIPAANNAMRTYNRTRPFILNKQELIQHGVGFIFQYMHKEKKGINQGIALQYANAFSVSKNTDWNNVWLLHSVQLQYTPTYTFFHTIKGPFLGLHAGIEMLALSRYINGDTYFADDKAATTWGVGPILGVQSGYNFTCKSNKLIRLYISGTINPYLYFPGIESNINQTQGLINKASTWNYQMKAGIQFGFKTKKTKIVTTPQI